METVKYIHVLFGLYGKWCDNKQYKRKKIHFDVIFGWIIRNILWTYAIFGFLVSFYHDSIARNRNY